MTRSKFDPKFQSNIIRRRHPGRGCAPRRLEHVDERSMTDPTSAPSSNPAITVVMIIVVVVIAFFGFNLHLYYQAQKLAPRKARKPLGAKQKKRQLRKQGLRTAGE
jgi:hypothetical protein